MQNITSVKQQNTSACFWPLLIFILAASFYLYEFTLQVATSVMTQQLMADFHIDAAQLGAMSAYFYYAYAPMQLPGGLLYDRFDTRNLMTFAILICALGAVFFAVAHTIYLASLARFMMGFGSAFSFVGVLVLIAHWFEAKHFALLAGITQLMGSFGAIAGEMPLVHLIHWIGWRNSMLLLGAIGIVLAILVWFIVREAPSKQIAKVEKQHHAETEWQRLRSVLTSQQNWFIALYSFTIWAPVVVFAALWGVPFLVRAYGYTVLQASAGCAMIWVGIGIGSPLLGWMSDKIHKRRIILIFTAIIGLLSSSVILFSQHLSMPICYSLLFIYGLAAGSQVLTFAAIKDNNVIEHVGTASGFNNAAVVAGGALLQPLTGFLLRYNWHHHYAQGVPVYSTNNFEHALILIPICFLVAIISSVCLIKESYRSH